MADVSPQLQEMYKQFLDSALFKNTLNTTTSQVCDMVLGAGPNADLPMLNRQVNKLVEKQQFALSDAYIKMLVDANIDVRKHHHPQVELDDFTRQLANDNQLEINRSANAAHPMRQFDGANVNPANRPQDNKPGDSLVTAQDLKRAQSDKEFENDLRLRLQAKLSMPGPRPSAPRPDRGM